MSLRRKETTVVGTDERVPVYSCDGVRWFSDKLQAERGQQARLKFLQQSARSLKKTATFGTGQSRPVGGRRRTK